jgi:transcriptional regulator with XRE-family HTH domain
MGTYVPKILVILEMPATYSFKASDPYNKRKSHQTREANNGTQRLKASHNQISIKARINELKPIRKTPSIAVGLARYRKAIELSRTKFAEEFGITRRALFNYEKGTRAVPGDLLERVVARGDVELSDVFGLPPEPATPRLRIADAKLVIEVFEAFRAMYPDAIDDDAKFFIAYKTAQWQTGVKRTPKSIERFISRIINEMDEHYRMTAYSQ